MQNISGIVFMYSSRRNVSFQNQLHQQSLDHPGLVSDCVLASVDRNSLQRLFNHSLHISTIDLTVIQELNALLIHKHYLNIES